MRTEHTACLDLLVLGLVAGQVGGGAGRGEGAGQAEDDHALALEDVRRRHVLPREGVVAADLGARARDVAGCAAHIYDVARVSAGQRGRAAPRSREAKVRGGGVLRGRPGEGHAAAGTAGECAAPSRRARAP